MFFENMIVIKMTKLFHVFVFHILGYYWTTCHISYFDLLINRWCYFMISKLFSNKSARMHGIEVFKFVHLLLKYLLPLLKQVLKYRLSNITLFMYWLSICSSSSVTRRSLESKFLELYMSVEQQKTQNKEESELLLIKNYISKKTENLCKDKMHVHCKINQI